MRTGLLKNYGPTQIFPEPQRQERSKTQYENNKVEINDEKKKSKSINTFGVENRDFYDQLRLKSKQMKLQNQNAHKPIFKVKGDQVLFLKNKDRELYPFDIQWNNSQLGRTQGEISGKIDKNYAKIRRYQEGSSSVIDYSQQKTYDKYNSYTSIVNQERFSKDCDTMYRTINNAQKNSGIIQNRTKYQVDWIQRGKY